MKFLFHREAEREFDIAVEYYEGCRPGLGLEFAAEVYAAVKWIAAYPAATVRINELPSLAWRSSLFFRCYPVRHRRSHAWSPECSRGA